MSIARRHDLRAFRDFLDAKLADGEADLTPDEALGLWAMENPTPEELADSVAALREGYAQLLAGQTRDAREVLEELRRKYDIPTRHELSRRDD